jgi:hypothetical protein
MIQMFGNLSWTPESIPEVLATIWMVKLYFSPNIQYCDMCTPDILDLGSVDLRVNGSSVVCRSCCCLVVFCSWPTSGDTSAYFVCCQLA